MAIDFVQKAAIEICSKALNSAYKPYVMEIKVLEIEDLISQAVTKTPQTICRQKMDINLIIMYIHPCTYTCVLILR